MTDTDLTDTNGSQGASATVGRVRLGRAPAGQAAANLPVLLGMGGLLAVLAGAVLVAVLLIAGLYGDARHITDSEIRYATAIDAAMLNAKAIANDERGFLLSGDAEFIEELDVRTGNARLAFSVAANEADSPAQRRAVGEANEGFELWVHALREETAMFEAGDRERAIKTSLGPTRALRKGYEKSLARAQALGVQEIQSARSSVSAASKRSVAILLGYLAVALAIGIVVTAWAVRRVVRSGREPASLGGETDSVQIDAQS